MTALIFIARHWRILAPLAAIALVVAALAYARYEREGAGDARVAAKAATHQARANQAVAEITDTLHRREARAHAAADQEVAHVEDLPGADAPLDPVRRARLCAALERLFDHGPGGCVAEPSADPARTLPTPDHAAANPGRR